jgi:hypothetical protein
MKPNVFVPTLDSIEPAAVQAHIKRIAEMESGMVRAISAEVAVDRDSVTATWLAEFVKHRVYMALEPPFASYADWIRARFAAEISALAAARKRDAAWAEKRIRQALDYRAGLYRNGNARHQEVPGSPADAFVSRIIRPFSALTLEEQKAVLAKLQALYLDALARTSAPGKAGGTRTPAKAAA